MHCSNSGSSKYLSYAHVRSKVRSHMYCACAMLMRKKEREFARTQPYLVGARNMPTSKSAETSKAKKKKTTKRKQTSSKADKSKAAGEGKKGGGTSEALRGQSQSCHQCRQSIHSSKGISEVKSGKARLKCSTCTRFW